MVAIVNVSRTTTNTTTVATAPAARLQVRHLHEFAAALEREGIDPGEQVTVTRDAVGHETGLRVRQARSMDG